MPRKTKVTEAPYDTRGHLMHYAYDSYNYDTATGVRTVTPPDMRPNQPFTADLHINGMHSGRSAKYVEWTDPDGHRFPMFITDLLDLMSSGTITDGNTGSRTWYVRKRGQNYGIALWETTA